MADKLTERERAVLELIPRGAANAVPCADVEAILGLDRRIIHQTVFALNLRGYVVASSRDGYFLPTTPSEWRSYYRGLLGSHIQREKRLQAIERAAARAGVSLE